MTPITPKAAFRAAYALHLARQHKAHPEQYGWAIEELPVVVGRMMDALEQRRANINSPAIKAACKMCHFKPGIQRIADFLASPDWPTWAMGA